MPLFIPKRVIVKKECHLSPRTKLYITNIKKYFPSVEVTYLNDNFTYPEHFSPKQKYDFAKETVIIGERTTPFIVTFASPGNIVEQFETVINPSWMCSYQCEFCYLQLTQPPEHMLYTNFHVLKHELETAPYAHTAILTIWSMLSFAKREPYLRIPLNLLETSDWLRKHFIEARINTDQKAIRSLFGKQKIIYDYVNAEADGIKRNEFCVDRERITFLYEQNKQFPLWLNTSEFLDAGGVEHITGNIEYLLTLLPEYSEMRLSVRTRSNNLDVLTKYPLHGRVRATIILEPQTIIDSYAHGTASLEDRIELLSRLQAVDGLDLRIAMEPVFFKESWSVEYDDLLMRTFNKVDSKRITIVTIGFPRYRPQLKSMIRMHFPATTLFNTDQDLQKPESTLDDRMRYSYDRREEMFKALMEKLLKHGIAKIDLGAEGPKMWDKVGLVKLDPLKSTVYQYDGQSVPATGQNAPLLNKKFDRTKTIGASMDYSLEFNAAFESIQAAEEEIDDEKFNDADQLLNSVLSFDESLWKWTSLKSIRISEALNGSFTWKPIKIVGFLSLVNQPEPLEIDGEEISLAHFSITDLDDTQIDCLRVPYQNYQQIIEKMQTSKQLFCFLGTIVSVNTSKKKAQYVYRFYIKQISDIVTAEDMITIRPSKTVEKEVWDFELKKLGPKTIKFKVDQPSFRIMYIIDEMERKGVTRNHIIEYIKDQITTNLNIKGLRKGALQLGLAIEFAIIQAISQHRSKYSYKLHSLVIGPPNVGKGFLPRILKILSPCFDELPSNSPKLTSAGLVGTVQRRGKKNISTNGVLPKNSGGTIAIQDFHEIRDNKRKELFAIFTKMMEDGEVIDKTSANTIHEAIVSLHLDTNRYSQVYKDRKFNSFQDLDIPMNVLSRFDFIMEIPKNARRQQETSVAMVGATELKAGEKENPEWIKELKMLIAYLRSTYLSTFITEEVAEYIKEKLTNVTKPYIHVPYFKSNYEDMQIRISFSVQKMLKAIACANRKTHVTKDDVDYAFGFVAEKIKFIASIDSAKETVSAIIDGNNPVQRQELYIKHFKDMEFTAKKGADLIKQETGIKVDEKTIKRDYKVIGAKIVNKKKGLWSI
ncbi:MAG: spore photoproduct lyase family protein [Bacteroidota bacterium]|jgi:DNA repair photolyase